MKKILLTTLCLSQVAYADILFIDMNNSSKEIQAAEKAATTRGEKLIVLPRLSLDDQKELAKISKELQIEKSKLRKLGCAASEEEMESMDNIPEDCNNRYGRLYDLEKQKEKITQKNFLNKNNLSKEIKAIKNSGVKLTSLILSGHDGNGHFFGENADLSEETIEEAFKKNPPMGNNIRSLMLWGCYTANLSSLTGNWKKMLPNVEMIAGFDGVAPAGSKPGSATYLEDALTQEKRLTEIKDRKTLEKNFKALRNVPTMNAAICIGDSFVSHKASLSLSEMYKICDSTDFQKIKDVYNCYKNATTPACANPPANTGNSELRAIYNKLQDTRHCLEVKPQPDLPTTDQVIRLIFFGNVKANYVKNALNDLKALDELLKKLGAPAGLTLSDMGKLTRAELLARFTKINQFLESITGPFNNQLYNNPLTPEAKLLAQKMSILQTDLGELKPFQIPFEWVEPNAKTKKDLHLKIDAESVKIGRQYYEQNRAMHLIETELYKLSSKDPKGAAVAQLAEQISKNRSEFITLNTSCANQNNQNCTDRFQVLYSQGIELGSKKSKLLKELTVKYKTELQAFGEELKKRPYSHAEGKEAFINALNQMDYNQINLY